ncbi:alpha/beta hydrolase family protein [Hymenobacter jeollabukensis]|uniref:Alpha/beta hydrolase n=1 Tax=Hymenobacter jeollabukensis TaxID=2025313 RepID=A0A5R8WWK4_9BACT|nr:alpha/beta hydrolase [Hymenobacter jeollabukensis]TLM96729.1 alpha/beta hydrolase [Hymenobacter jeollabukensis]
MSDFVGYCAAQVADADLNLTFPVAVFYPTDTASQPETIGLYQLDVARDAAPLAGPFPLVLLSHGTGSSGMVHRNLALDLARRGYVVALPEHPHNNRDDDSWAHTAQNLQARPRHLQLAIDHLLTDARLASVIRPNAVALIGHSLGSYTALALAGGRPTSVSRTPADGPPRLIPVPAADARVRALVLLAPAIPWFLAEGSLRGVQVPVLALAGEQDEHIPPGFIQHVLNGLPDANRLDYRLVANAGHFSFLSPFPAARVSPQFPPSQDPPGFDRARFHQQELYPAIADFLGRLLR